MTSPFSTAMPETAMNPTPADIENGIRQIHNASTPPVSASGTPLNTMAASRADPKAMNSSPKIITSTTGTTTLSRCEAEMSCSKVPP